MTVKKEITKSQRTLSQRVHLLNDTVEVHFIAIRAASVVVVPRLRLQLPDQTLGVEGGRRVSEGELGGGGAGKPEVVWRRELLREFARQRLHSACETTCSRY